MVLMLSCPFHSQGLDNVDVMDKPVYAFAFHKLNGSTPEIYEIQAISQNSSYYGFHLSENSIDFDWIQKPPIQALDNDSNYIWYCLPIYDLQPSDWRAVQTHSLLILDLKTGDGIKKVGTPPVPLPLPAPRPMVMSYSVYPSIGDDSEYVYSITKELEDRGQTIVSETIFIDLEDWMSDIDQWMIDNPAGDYLKSQFEHCVYHISNNFFD